MPTRVAVITNPTDDRITQYLNSWFQVVIADIANLSTNVDIHELKKDEVAEKNLVKLIEEKNPQLILFHGHGDSKTIYGFNKNILITCDDNEELLKNRIIHSLTCDSGKELGPKCVGLGTKAFVGYKKEFKFAHLGKDTSALQKSDSLAEMFFRPALEIDKALLEGDNLEQAHGRSQRMYANNLLIFLTSNNPDLEPCRGRLYHDMVNQVVLGDQSCSF